jgi:hypothetical protein
VAEAENKLASALKGRFPVPGSTEFPHHTEAHRNTTVIVACADFFGVRKDRLPGVLRSWQKCFRQKIFVEMAVPNALLAECEHPFILNDYLWDGTVQAQEWEKLVLRLLASERTAFAHPIKLSAVPNECIEWLRSGVTSDKGLNGKK